jgi:hypothetical protein
MLGYRLHVCQVTDFQVCADGAIADYELNIKVWEVIDDLPSHGYAGVQFITDTKDDLVLWVVLPAEGREVRVGIPVKTTKGLQDGQGWVKV